MLEYLQFLGGVIAGYGERDFQHMMKEIGQKTLFEHSEQMYEQ